MCKVVFFLYILDRFCISGLYILTYKTIYNTNIQCWTRKAYQMERIRCIFGLVCFHIQENIQRTNTMADPKNLSKQVFCLYIQRLYILTYKRNIQCGIYMALFTCKCERCKHPYTSTGPEVVIQQG